MLGRRLRHVRAFIARLLADRRGVAAVFLAVSLVPMVGAIGLAVDSSLGYLLKTRMGKSLDAAGLAAGRIALDDDVEATAEAFFLANFGESNDTVKVKDFAFEIDENNHFVTLSATATAPTYFMRVFGHQQMTVSARTVVERETTGMELALVLDNTGSMQDDDKFENMQQAAYDLIEILYGTDNVIDNLWVSVVPFVASVNIGSSRTSWIAAGDRVHTNPTSWGSPSNKWKGCVMARAYPLDTGDTPPSGGLFSSYRWASKSNRNYACGAPIKSLTASRTEIDAALGAMAAAPKAGGTTTNFGLVWGWRTLSPRWRGEWGGSTPSDMPLDYDIDGNVDDGMEKVVVVLTDGENQLVYNDYTSFGFPSTLGYNDTLDSRPMLDARMIEVCDAMKAEGIRIYSIAFGSPITTSSRDLLEECATTEAMYYEAVTKAEIAAAFKSIGGQLANLRIVE